MKLKDVKIESIKVYDKNPRKNEKAVEVVKKSIQEFGFKIPVLLDKEGVIVAGHTRVEAAKQLGMKKVPAIYADDLTEKQVKALRIMDNKSQEYAEWDKDLLVKEFKFLNNVGFDVELTGFSAEDVDSELKLNEVEDANLFDERYKVIMLTPPEAPRLKERKGFFCDDIKDYNKIKKYFEKKCKLDVQKLLELMR